MCNSFLVGGFLTELCLYMAINFWPYGKLFRPNGFYFFGYWFWPSDPDPYVAVAAPSTVRLQQLQKCSC